MNIFGSKLTGFSARSESAMGVFTKTVDKLQAVNDESKAAREKNQLDIDLLNQENSDLSALENENQKFIDKIKDFLR